MSTESTSNEPNTTANPERDASGRFQPGNPGGPGNPFGGRAATLRRLMLERVSEEELTAIIDRVIAMAKDGHWQAIKLVLAYTLGKPSQVHDSLEMPEEAPDVEPSTNGIFYAPPSANGASPEAPAPGEPAEAPSTNGIFSPRNRKERRALRKAQRIARRHAAATPVGP